MPGSVGIVGAGLIGRCLAIELAQRNFRVTIFDRDDKNGSQSCAWTGAGMLTPYAELDSADEIVIRLGRDSLRLWKDLLKRLSKPVFFQDKGSLVVAHSSDKPEMQRFRERVGSRLSESEAAQAMQMLDAQQLSELEPQLEGRFTSAIYFPNEGQIDNRQLLSALEQGLRERDINWFEHVDVQTVESHCIEYRSAAGKNERKEFDWAIDCRGLGARPSMPDLRGVRGELISVHAPDVELGRPIRLIHPRYSIYIVPRQEGEFLVGATSIESEDKSPITVQSTLELLSAAFTLHPGFAYASVTECRVNCRPALPDNHPRIFVGSGIVRVNGLYRHGFLLTPKLVNLATEAICTGQKLPEFESVFSEETSLSASAC
jgi:glycine oxidase